MTEKQFLETFFYKKVHSIMVELGKKKSSNSNEETEEIRIY